ncbi:MAG: acylphosphatase [Nocardioides sp.]
MSSDNRAVDVRVTGQVQGVFFRAGCREEAERLGVLGWVSNEPDGSVRGYFAGARDAVDALVDWCRTGSARSEVDAVEVTDAEPREQSGFDTR